jgi:hypothetical protein
MSCLASRLMSCSASRLALLLAIGLAGTGFARQAEACISFDRAAEMRLIDQAIAAEKRTDIKLQLSELREVILGNEEDHFPVELDKATVQALALIGKERIVKPGAAAKTRATPVERIASPRGAAPASCG